MTATEQVREDLALRMSRFPIIEAPAMCEVIALDAARNLLARRAVLAAERRFTGEPLTGFDSLEDDRTYEERSEDERYHFQEMCDADDKLGDGV